MLITMAGLPGTGKSTVARELARALSAVVLDKDAVRAALFPPEDIEYSSEQDDLCVSMMLQVAGFMIGRRPDRPVILDGRTFSRSYQVAMVVRAAGEIGTELYFIECTCTDETAIRRLTADRVSGVHPAANRDADLYRRVKARAEPLTYPHLTLDTERPLAACVAACLDYLKARSA